MRLSLLTSQNNEEPWHVVPRGCCQRVIAGQPVTARRHAPQQWSWSEQCRTLSRCCRLHVSSKYNLRWRTVYSVEYSIYICLQLSHCPCHAVSLTRVEIIGSGNFSLSMMVIGLLLPILRQWCLMYDVYWLPDGCCIWGRHQNTWNTIPVSEQKTTNE